MMGSGGMKLREKKRQSLCCDACCRRNIKLQMLTHLRVACSWCSAGVNNQAMLSFPQDIQTVHELDGNMSLASESCMDTSLCVAYYLAKYVCTTEQQIVVARNGLK